MNTHNLFPLVCLLAPLSSQAAVLIDLDLTQPGIQNSITDATEGQVIQIALVVTGMTATNPCMNGIGGDISTRGTMTVAFDSLIQAGDIAGFTNEGSARSIAGIPGPLNPGDPLTSAGLAPLTGYTQNVGGAGYRDPGNNLDGDLELFSFLSTPGGANPYATIFTTSITVTNINGTTLELFPSGIFNNPATETNPAGDVALNPTGIPNLLPTQFAQEGTINLHTQSHDFQNCSGEGLGSLQGASISGVPEPSSALLTGTFACLLLLKRSRH
ncbi:MAG: hypothetical protein ACSHYF_10665 [Verrucomicrobiaceae bacterium]